MILTLAAAVHLSPAIAWAQKSTVSADEEQGWMKWAIAAGLGVVICVTGFINAKRSHLN